MADPILVSNLGDVAQGTLQNTPKNKIVDLSASLVEYHAAPRIFRKSKIKEMKNGKRIDWPVKVSQAGNADHIALGAPDVTSIPDNFITATADWRGSCTSSAMLAEEEDLNAGAEMIFDVTKTRDADAQLDIIELFESTFFGPPVASDDNVTPYGLKTLIVKNATEGFNGGAPSGFTTLFGINPTTHANFRNWTFQYAAVTQDDMIRKCRKAAFYTNFKSPVQILPSMKKGDEKVWHTNYAVTAVMEEYLDSRNDNLGPDIAKHDGAVFFKRRPVETIPKLDTDTTNPFYGVNYAWVGLAVLKGWWMRPTIIKHWPGVRTLSAKFWDCRYQVILYNRRECFVGATATTEPS